MKTREHPSRQCKFKSFLCVGKIFIYHFRYLFLTLEKEEILLETYKVQGLSFVIGDVLIYENKK